MTERFTITFKRGAYYVSIPNYSGGEVVPAAEYDRLAGEHETLKDADRIHAGVGKVREERISRLTAERDGLRKALDEVRAALFEPTQSHAGLNLDGALYDIRRFSERGQPTDTVCIVTIDRVVKQIAKAQAALTPRDPDADAGGAR